MKRFAMCFAMLFSVTVVPVARAAEALLPAPSVWVLNVAKSDFGGIPGMKSDVWRVTVSNAKEFKYTDRLVLESGQTVVSRWDGPPDGTPRASPGWAGVKMGYNAGDKTMTATMPDGSTMNAAMALSDGDKVLTVKNEVRGKDGKTAHQTLVYERKR